LLRGLLSHSADVISIGLGPSPMLYYSVHESDVDGGIMITGSHNPPTHNGFKMMAGKASLFGSEIAEIRRGHGVFRGGHLRSGVRP
jgi:phosphomannomutase